jgi:hypothetical protein
MLQTPTLPSADFADYTWPEAELARFNAYMADLPPSVPLDPTRPVPQPPPSDKDGRAVYFIAQINYWLANRKQLSSEYMSPEEIGKAEDRGFLLRRALIDSIATYYREHPGVPVAPGVLVLDIVFSDNCEGCSWVSAKRYAELLGCDEKAVRRARMRHAQEGLIGRTKNQGFSDRHWAIINRAFAGQDLHPAWWLDATSDPPAPRGNHSGKPRTKPRTSDVHPLAEAKPRTSAVRPLDKTPDIQPLNPGHLMSDDFSSDFQRKESGGGGAAKGRAAAGPTQAEIDVAFAQWWAHYPRKEAKFAAKKAYAIIVSGAHRDPEAHATPQQLLGNIGIACGEASGIVVLDIDPRNDGDATGGFEGAQISERPKVHQTPSHVAERWFVGRRRESRAEHARGRD